MNKNTTIRACTSTTQTLYCILYNTTAPALSLRMWVQIVLAFMALIDPAAINAAPGWQHVQMAQTDHMIELNLL